MTNTLATSENEIDYINDLLDKNIPSFRQAYSDRTAWIMSCISELSYIKFNPLLNDKNKIILLERISSLIKSNDSSLVTSIIESFSYDHVQEIENLIETLNSLDMNLMKTFDKNGTQAILVLSKQTNMLILAFRGTESNSIKDIKSDADARITRCDSGGNVHSGFKKAYEQISLEIETELNKPDYSSIPLFITGHSLGGSLATIASKKLDHKAGIAACYTYGSPRVGDEDWLENMKTPIYRLVNSADCVTMLPPGSETISIVSWFFKYIPYFGHTIRRWLLSNFGGYLHCGNMRYLTNCNNGQYESVKLLYSVSLFRRLKGLIIKSFPWNKFLSDHSISIYRKKLAVIAHKRNNINV